MITGLLVAAGHSTRMGTVKQLMPFGDVSILEQVVRALTTSKVQEVVVVLGFRSDEIRIRLAPWPVKVVLNPDPDGDMLSSIHCGIKAISEDHAVLIALGDQPLISSNIINILVEEYEKEPTGMILPVYNGKRGHPMIIAPSFRKLLLSHTDGGLKALRDRYEDQVRTIQVNTDTILIDLDYYHEYEQAIKRLAKGI